jgi:hypothetical protein
MQVIETLEEEEAKFKWPELVLKQLIN